MLTAYCPCHGTAVAGIGTMRDGGQAVIVGSPRGKAKDVNFYDDLHRRYIEVSGAHGNMLFEPAHTRRLSPTWFVEVRLGDDSAVHYLAPVDGPRPRLVRRLDEALRLQSVRALAIATNVLKAGGLQPEPRQLAVWEVEGD